MSRAIGSDEATWTGVVRSVARKIADDQIPGRAAQMSFYFFPFRLSYAAHPDGGAGPVLDEQWLVHDVILERLASVGQSADPAVHEEIRRFLTGHEEISDVLNLITLQHGAPMSSWRSRHA